MVVFFIGIGVSSILASAATSPVQIAISLTLIGVFAAIYHPVGLAMVVQGREKAGIPLAINGIYGNMGVASAALLTGFLIDSAGWRSAFYLPGMISILLGIAYLIFIRKEKKPETLPPVMAASSVSPSLSRNALLIIFAIIFFTTALGGLIFQSTTFALPKIFEERLTGFAGTATMVGWYAFLVFAMAAMAQLVVGYLVDRYSVRYVFALVALCQMVLFFIMSQLDGIAALLVAVGFMFAVFGQIPINDVLVGRVTRSEWRSRAFGLRYVVTFSVMASAVPLIGWVHVNWGFDRLFNILAVAALAIFMAVLFLPNASGPRIRL